MPDDDAEMAAANAAMMAKPKIVGKGTMLYSDSNRGGEYEERKTTVINVSKNIYKPSFNLPTKDLQPAKDQKTKQSAKTAKIKDETRPPKTTLKPSVPEKAEVKKSERRNDSAAGKKSEAKIYSKPNVSSRSLIKK